MKKPLPLSTRSLSRREFIASSAALSAAALGMPSLLGAATGAKRTAADQVTLGRSGIKLSRLGIGLGSDSGNVQRALGHEGFNRLVRHAYDQGITYLDTAESYRNHDWVREAIKGLPREKLYIQTKMSSVPEKPLELIDRFRKDINTDYIDSLLIHCMIKKGWTDQRKRLMDAFLEAQDKKLIRAKGVSCHSLPALDASAQSDWMDVQLVRVNPQAKHIDGPVEDWNTPGNDLNPVLDQIKIMRAKGRGIIGMKLVGNGDFTEPADREKSIRFAMQCGLLDAVVIGFKSTAEIDEAIERINRALAEA